jgi:Fe2+ or Zn2+ uptake regulation protein
VVSDFKTVFFCNHLLLLFDHFIVEFFHLPPIFADNVIMVIEEQQEMIAKKYGFKITDHSMYLYGICQECQGKGD